MKENIPWGFARSMPRAFFFGLDAAWLNGSLSGRSPFCQLNQAKNRNQEYAKAAKKCRFVEVFSGPNAPLSHSVGEEFGVDVPGRRLETGSKGVKREVQHLFQLLKEDIGNLELPRSGTALQPTRRVESFFHQ